MTSRIVKTEFDRKLLIKLIQERELPFTCEISRKRTTDQNRLQRKWVGEIAEQLDMTAEEVRGYCKLHIGVPILREENEHFRAKYDAIVKPLPYESKLAIMMEPLDLPVTRIMSTRQKSLYLEMVLQHFVEKGVALTIPLEERAARKAAA